MINKKKAKVIKCIICKQKVELDPNARKLRDTCNKVEVDGKFIKSDCEKKKCRLYQDKYREKNNKKKRGKGKIPKYVQSSFAEAINPLCNIKAEKVNRTCLSCDKPFIGLGRYNRICERCTRLNTQYRY
jgi:hypothetical protein